MGFWDFLKKKKPVEKESLSFSQLESWLQDKKQEAKKQEHLFLREIQDKLRQLIEELQKEIQVLKSVNVEGKKAEDKVKLVVKENLENYIYYLDKLLGKLEEITKEQEEKPDREFVEKINSLFSDFQKKSHLSFEKATFLIGEELGNVKESINNFFRSLKSILEENKGIIEKLNVISLAEAKIKKLSELEKNELEVKNNIKEYEEKTSSLGKQIKIKEEDIEKIKTSEKFLAENKKRELLNAKKEGLEREISNLRVMINFKALTNFYHSFEKEMALIKQYREYFKDSFNKTKGQDLLDMLKESKLETAEIRNKIQEIEEKEREMSSIVIEKTGIEDKENEIKELLLKIESFNEAKAPEEKRLKKLQESSEGVKKEIKDELTKINVKVN